MEFHAIKLHLINEEKTHSPVIERAQAHHMPSASICLTMLSSEARAKQQQGKSALSDETKRLSVSEKDEKTKESAQPLVETCQVHHISSVVR